MTHIFKGSSKPTIGIEIEMQLLDANTLDLTPQAQKIIESSKDQGMERVKSEIHQSMLEVDTEICYGVKDCGNLVKSRLKRLNVIAKEHGIQLAIAGTHPFQEWAKRIVSSQERYQNLLHKYQWLIRRSNTYGLHVHVGMESGDQCLAASTAMIRYFPHLIALSANSPFWQCIDNGVQSSRVTIMETFPYGGNPVLFKNWKEFEHYYDTMTEGKIIGSMKDLHWHTRPNLEFGTIEFRICDGMSLFEETMAVVSFIQCLAVYVCKELKENRPGWEWTKEQQWIATENQWRAARDGLNGQLIAYPFEKPKKISDAILELMEHLLPIANQLDCAEELSYVKTILNKGNGSNRQRRIFAETQSFREIVSSYVQEFQSSYIDDHQKESTS